uniref:Copper transport protein n=1 Tax=Eptatretus burgeri TaxID=7764 RepID=A0A8C4NIU2_EPTBU
MFSRPRSCKDGSTDIAMTSTSVSLALMIMDFLPSFFASLAYTASSDFFVNHFLKRLFCSSLHVLQVSTGYILMLAVMSYNAWVLFGIVAGAGLGYFLSYPFLTAKENTNNDNHSHHNSSNNYYLF